MYSQPYSYYQSSAAPHQQQMTMATSVTTSGQVWNGQQWVASATNPTTTSYAQAAATDVDFIVAPAKQIVKHGKNHSELVQHYTTYYHHWNAQSGQAKAALASLPPPHPNTPSNNAQREEMERREKWAAYYASNSAALAHYHLALGKSGGVGEPYARPSSPPAPPQMSGGSVAGVAEGGRGSGGVSASSSAAATETVAKKIAEEKVSISEVATIDKNIADASMKATQKKKSRWSSVQSNDSNDSGQIRVKPNRDSGWAEAAREGNAEAEGRRNGTDRVMEFRPDDGGRRRLPAHTLVLVRGLRNAPELNGTVGRIVRRDEATGRYGVDRLVTPLEHHTKRGFKTGHLMLPERLTVLGDAAKEADDGSHGGGWWRGLAGITPDSLFTGESVQKILDAAPRGALVRLPAGVFDMHAIAEITIKKPLKLVGEGRGRSQTQFSRFMDSFVVSPGPRGPGPPECGTLLGFAVTVRIEEQAAGEDHLELEDFAVIGGPLDVHGGGRLGRCNIRRVRVEMSRLSGRSSEDTLQVHDISAQREGAARDGRGDPACVIDDCDVLGGNGDGVFVDTGRCLVNNCRILHSGCRGMFVQGHATVTVRDTTIQGAGSYGIKSRGDVVREGSNDIMGGPWDAQPWDPTGAHSEMNAGELREMLRAQGHIAAGSGWDELLSEMHCAQGHYDDDTGSDRDEFEDMGDEFDDMEY